ncbi:nuclease [Mycolicibacterium conceptionense]|uniref:Nuclease n=1 Tax=Mycolicibacterium conceptionense TaxID=451644 RepID=A0A0U1E0B9_9MYCO|nr:nuclease [Mycolicibacterium conceptionense]
MTDTTQQDVVETAQFGTLEHLDPATLEIGENVRDEAILDKSFLASIAENGVLTPITAVRSADNADVIRVRNGQMRTLAARELGLATVPVYVLPSSAADASEETIERIVHQIVTNDHVKAITEAQRARGIQQMLSAGVSQTKVAKKLSVKRDTVKAAAAAAKSNAAMTALDTGQLSLEEAAALSEFDGDDDAIEKLIAVAGTTRFAFRVEELRQARERDRAYAAAVQDFTERGYRVIEHDEAPVWDDTTCLAIEYLRSTDGERATEDAVTDPAHWAVMLYEEDATPTPKPARSWTRTRSTGPPGTTTRPPQKRACDTSTAWSRQRFTRPSGTAWTTKPLACSSATRSRGVWLTTPLSGTRLT